jgi:hypothetical protein
VTKQAGRIKRGICQSSMTAAAKPKRSVTAV